MTEKKLDKQKGSKARAAHKVRPLLEVKVSKQRTGGAAESECKESGEMQPAKGSQGQRIANTKLTPRTVLTT